MSKESVYRAIEDNKQYVAEAIKRLKFPCTQQLVENDFLIAQRVLKEINAIVHEKTKAMARDRRRQGHVERLAFLIGSIVAAGFPVAEVSLMIAEAIKSPKVRTRKRSKKEPEQGPAQPTLSSDPS